MSTFKPNPNFERELRQEIGKNLSSDMDRKIEAMARRLKGKDRNLIRSELQRAGFTNIKEESMEAMHEGKPIPSKVAWR
jgi:hypothetical protein